MQAPYYVNEYFFSMLPGRIQQIYLETVLLFLEIVNTLNFYLPLDVIAVSKIEPLTIDKIKLPLLSLAMLVSE